MSLISIKNLTFAYDGSYDNVFENVNIQLDTAWRLGLTGRNGRGKTTLLKLLRGEYGYKGTISASVDFAYFPYDVADKTALAGEIMAALCPEAQEWERVRELSRLDVDEDILYRPFNLLSGGEQTKLLLAALFIGENRFLLIDEPTNHLDAHGREVVAKYLRGKSGFILVSHDRSFLDGCIDHIMSINRTDIEVKRGNFSSWIADKERRDTLEAAQNERLKKEVVRLSQAAARTSKWSDEVEKTKFDTKNSGLRPDRGYVGHKAAKMMKRSKVIEARHNAAIEEKKTLLKNVETADALKIATAAHYSRQLLRLTDVSVLYEGYAAFAPISFNIEQGERIALCGANGCGKTSLLKLICGEPLDYTGDIYRASGLKISYIAQNAFDLSGSLSDYAARYSIDESRFKTILRKLDFARVQFEKDINDFSAGQKKKVLLARSLCESAHILVWDEPLNFIDVMSRIQLETLLRDFAPTILFTEHDKTFCDNVATRVVTM